ncbi:hypothetical protein ACFV20_19410 [Streptomyces sp. NPDC059696]|uniref:hypothetical protein n=1 Tax=Streptomyces sp. NPDC059696 TaxID=3346911 RepID=UPI0036CED7DA
MTDQPKRAMTMREIREGLGHVKPGQPEPIVQATGYVVSCLPEGHDERFLFTVQVEYRGDGKWAVVNRTRLLGYDGTWSFGFHWRDGAEPTTDDECDEYEKAQGEWIAAHRFDHDTALSLAKEAAKRLEYRGYGVAQALAEGASRG